MFLKREAELLVSAARKTDPAQRFALSMGSRLILAVDITARAGTGTLTPSLVMLINKVGAAVTLWTAGSPIDSSNTTVLYEFSNAGELEAVAGYTEQVQMLLPANMRLNVAHSDGTNAITYSAHIVEIP